MKQPRCSLCSGELTKETNVDLMPGALVWALAWVCTDCSAAFPIALGQTAARNRTAKPLYEDGKKAK